MIAWPAKECDYDSADDYAAAITAVHAAGKEESQECFTKGQYVCALQKNDGLGYAMFQVQEINCSVSALLHAPHETGVLKHYPPGMYALVAFSKLMPGVSHFFNTRFNIRFL